MADVAIPSSGGAVVAGVYTGDGAEERTIPLGFTPSAVLVTCKGYFTSQTTNNASNAVAIQGFPVLDTHSSTQKKILEIVPGGFKVFSNNVQYGNVYTNWEGTAFVYIAFR